MRHLMLLPMLLACTPAQARDQEAQSTQIEREDIGPAIEVFSGVEYEEGDYGTSNEVQTLSVPNTLRVTAGRVQLSATLPYERIEGPANVVSGGGLLGLPIIIDPTIPPDGRRIREGIGDLRFGASYGIPTHLIDVTLSGEVKLPTAADDMGTGETDFGVGMEISKTLGGGVTPFASVSYTMPGDPETYALRNSFAFQGGIAAPIGSRARGYVSYSRAESLSPTLEDNERIVGGVNAALGDRLTLGLFGAAGLSDGAPDVGAGLRLGVRIK